MRITSTPGEILKEEYMVPNGLSAVRLAKLLGIDESMMSRVINGKVNVSSEMALRLGKVLGTTAMFWMNLQADHNLSVARADKAFQAELNKLKPYFKQSITENREDAQIDS